MAAHAKKAMTRKPPTHASASIVFLLSVFIGRACHRREKLAIVRL
jgi:hypothetical protein